MLESTGGLNKQKTLAKTEGYQVAVAFNKFLPVTPISTYKCWIIYTQWYVNQRT
jgi:hypothetical protein